MTHPIPYAVMHEVRERAGDKCEGLYRRVKGVGAERIGPCPCRGRFRLVYAHIKHRGNGGCYSRDVAENILLLCQYGHDFFDQRISEREFKRLLNLPAHIKCFEPKHTGE